MGCQLGQKAAHHKRQLPANYGPVTHERTKAKIVKNEFELDNFFFFKVKVDLNENHHLRVSGNYQNKYFLSFS